MARNSEDRKQSSKDFEIAVLEARLADDTTSDQERAFFKRQLGLLKDDSED